MVREQFFMLIVDEAQALATLPHLLPADPRKACGSLRADPLRGGGDGRRSRSPRRSGWRLSSASSSASPIRPAQTARCGGSARPDRPPRDRGRRGCPSGPAGLARLVGRPLRRAVVAGDQPPARRCSALRAFVPADAVASRGVPLSRARAGEAAKCGGSKLSRMRAATGTRQAWRALSGQHARR